VLLNLVGNALDAIAAAGAEDGRVDIAVSATDETVTLVVRDNGPASRRTRCRACSSRSSRPRRSARGSAWAGDLVVDRARVRRAADGRQRRGRRRGIRRDAAALAPDGHGVRRLNGVKDDR
jgi:two-component system C4-dicarboxylate transport sensor histidine kinase DctB